MTQAHPRRAYRLLLILIVALLCLPVTARADETSEAPQDVEISTLDGLKGKRIGMLTGAVFDQLITQNMEGVNQFSYFNSTPDLIIALQNNVIDAIVTDEPIALLAVSRNEGIAVLPEEFMSDDYGFIFAKDSPLVPSFNEVIGKLWEDGTLDALKQKWTGSDEMAKTLPAQDWDAPNGTLVMAMEDSSEPMNYLAEGDKPRGYCCELGLLIAKELGYHLDIKPMTVAALFTSVQSNKADFGGSSISITEERKKSMDFSDPVYHGAVSFIVRSGGAAGSGAADSAPQLELATLDEVLTSRIGVIAGTISDQLILSTYDGVTDEQISYYNTVSELVGALTSNKIDSFVLDRPVAELAVNRNSGMAIMPTPLLEDHYGFALQKGSPLTPLFNERLAAYREDGTLDELAQEWTSAEEEGKALIEQDWDVPNGDLVVAVNADVEPMAYLSGDELRGMSIEVLLYIARDLGYHLELRPVNNAASGLAELQSGKADVAASCLSITDERKQVVDMTESYYDGGLTAVVRATGGAASAQDNGFLAGLAASFERTFITEDRWHLVLGGLLVTLTISVCSGALGLLLGFGLVLLRRRGIRAAEMLINGYEILMGGLPIVVVLMVFYYVIFGSLNISGILVAIIVFALVFGASSGAIMWNAIKGIDAGQTEAGRALGFSDSSTFFLVVLPQAARQFMPLINGQFVSLVKDTSVVGFIAVQDLTRAGDLIRSRTMEAFFPLFATAIIYFALCRILAVGLGYLGKKLDATNGPRTIKGVEL